MQETKRTAIDTLSSYRKRALPALADIAQLMWWNEEIRTRALDKIKEINESNV
jgi:hypothetical protein